MVKLAPRTHHVMSSNLGKSSPQNRESRWRFRISRFPEGGQTPKTLRKKGREEGRFYIIKKQIILYYIILINKEEEKKEGNSIDEGDGWHVPWAKVRMGEVRFKERD